MFSSRLSERRDSFGLMSGPIRIMHFTTSGEDSKYFQAIAAHHDASRTQLYFGSIGPSGPIHQRLAEYGVVTFALGASRRKDYPRAVVSLARILRRERIQVLQAHLYDGCAVGLPTARLTGVQARVLTGHHVVDSHMHFRHRGKRRAFMVDAAIARTFANACIAPSEHVRRTLLSAYGVRANRIRVIPYGFDFSAWRSSEAARKEMRRSLGVDGTTVFAALGRLYWAKDLPTLFTSFAGLRREQTDVRLLLIGSGPEEAALRSLAARLGIQDDVHFLGHRTDVPDVLAAVDVLVHPSIGEAFNQAIMEALAAGVFVVATDVGAAREVLANDRLGLVIEVGNAAGLLNAMRESLSLSRAHHAERRRVARGFTIDAMLSAYESLYEDLLTSASERS